MKINDLICPRLQYSANQTTHIFRRLLKIIKYRLFYLPFSIITHLNDPNPPLKLPD